MSAATMDALKEAVDRHVRDEQPDSITGAFVCIVETTTLDDINKDQGTFQVIMHGNHFTCRGLVECFRTEDGPEEDA